MGPVTKIKNIKTDATKILREVREKVRTTNIRTSKTKKISETSVDDQNIEKNN